jgi:uncharacterized protein (TIGR02246 family)
LNADRAPQLRQAFGHLLSHTKEFDMSRRALPSLLLFGILCVLAGSILHSHAQTVAGKEEDAIKKVIVATTQAFNVHDAKVFASYYTADAELVTVRGERMHGTAEIEKGLAAIFATRARGATLRTLDMTVRLIRSDVAIAHVTNEMIGVVDEQGLTMPPHRELSVRVLVKEKGIWRVTAFHNTVVNSTQGPRAKP